VLTLTTGLGGDGLLPDEHSLPESLASPSLGPGLLAIIGVCILLVLVLLVVVIITLCRAKSPEKEEESKKTDLREETQKTKDMRAPDLIPITSKRFLGEDQDDSDKVSDEEEEEDIYAVVRPERPLSRPPPTEGPAAHSPTCHLAANVSGLPQVPHHLSTFCPNAANSSTMSPFYHSTPYYSTSAFCPRAARHSNIYSSPKEISPYGYIGVQLAKKDNLDQSNMSTSSYSNRLSFSDDTTFLLPTDPESAAPQPRRQSQVGVINHLLESSV